MKILLVAKHSIIEPLGLLFLASTLHKEGHKVDIHLFKGEKLPLYKQISEEHYDFIGFSTYTGFHKTVFSLCKAIKDSAFDYDRLKLIIGGPHATFFSSECAQFADYVVVGEGLKSILSITRGAKPGIIFTPNLVPFSEIPIPRRNELYKAYPEFKSNPIKNVITSFGCPYTCSYCFNDSYKRLYKNFALRQRSTDSIIEECLEIKSYGTKMIFFEDDCFGYSIDWLKKFGQSYKSKIGLPFHCQLRPEMAIDSRLELLKLIGCHGVTVAIETFKDEVRQNILNRGLSLKKIMIACRKIKNHGLHLRTEQMLGLPYTTLKDEIDLLRVNVALKPDIAWTSIFAPYLGTKLGDHCLEQGLYSGNNDDLSDNFFSDSQLNFSHDRKLKTDMLQRVFSTCARIPKGDELANNFLLGGKYTFDKWFSAMRTHLYDNCLYSLQS